MINTVKSKYSELFTQSPSLFRAPGRINLILGHTDYNNGFVLPAAIAPPDTKIVGMSTLTAAINMPGTILSQFGMQIILWYSITVRS